MAGALRSANPLQKQGWASMCTNLPPGARMRVTAYSLWVALKPAQTI
jgi:hypothetical protein